jgi:hypothetical protein
MARRHRLVPQLADYDTNEPHLRPYLTFASAPDRRGTVLSTDALGFRRSTSPRGPAHTGNWAELARSGAGLVLGGSFVFGVGATGDGATVPSVLAELSGVPHLNLGVCAGNSLQELIAGIPFLAEAATVVVCSGVNNAFASVQSLGLNEIYGPMFYEGALARLGCVPLADLAGADRRAAPRDLAGGLRVTPTVGTGLVRERLDAAAAHQLRDLAVVAGAARDRDRLLFCLQPLADPKLRTLVPEERRLYELAAQRQADWASVRDEVVAGWGEYAARLAEGCQRIGVRFVQLGADRFAGWAFIDRVHMTDQGYRQVARLIWEAMGAV